MKPADVAQVPAPKRGHYDRTLTRRERQTAQRHRVMSAIAAVSSSERELNVANVVALAGIGRNTFYEYFDDIEHALLEIKRRASSEFAAHVDSELHRARTPLERIRGLAKAWTECIFNDGPVAKLALRAEPEVIDATQLSVLARQLVQFLSAESGARDALPGLVDPLRVLAVAALFDVVSRAHQSTRPMTRDELQRALADLSLRLLR